MREQKAKEERIELMRRQVLRRIKNQGIASGWSAWIELWEAKTYAMNRLREVGNRFQSPALADAFGFWERDTKEIIAEKAREGARSCPGLAMNLPGAFSDPCGVCGIFTGS